MKKWICCMGLVLCAGMAGAESQPVLDLRVNIAAWLESLPDSAATNEAYQALTVLGVSNVAVSVAVEEGRIFATAKVGTALADARSTWLSHTNLIQLEPVSEDEYKWVPEDPDDVAFQLSGDSMRIRFSGSAVLMATENRFSSAEAVDFNLSERSLLQGSVRMKPLLEPLFAALEKMVDAEEEGFGKAIMSAMLKSLKAAAQSVQDFPAVSFSIQALDPATRAMTLSLEFQTADAASETKAFFDNAADAWKNPKVSEKQLSLFGLVETPFFQGMELKGIELQFSYEWPSSEDPALFKTVMQAVVGSLFSFTDGRAFPINPEETMRTPNLGNEQKFNAARFEEDVRSALFFESSWKTHVSMVLDYLDVPNVDLLSAVVTNVSMQATNGVEILCKKSPGSFSFNPANSSGRISLRIEKDQPSPKTTSFGLVFTVPTETSKFTLTKESPLMESGDEGCCLIAMSNSVVSLRSNGLSLREAKVYALNAEGNYLKQTGSSRSAANYRGEYKGTPATVELFFPVKTESITLEFKNIAVGKDDKVKMPKNPTNSIITRYALEPLKTWSDPDMEAIAASSMTFVTNAGWKKNEVQLQFPKPDGVETERLTMKSYLAGVDEWLSRGEGSGSSSSGGHFYWDLKHTNAVNSASAIFGELEGSFWSAVETYSANVSTNPTPLASAQDLPTAWVEHNVAWIEYEKGGRILDIQAFDKTGRRLKKGNRTSSTNTKKGHYFWGLPSRVTVVYAASKESVVIPFEIELKEGGLDEIPATREKIAAYEEQLEFLKKIGKKARGRYGNLLSAFYYAHDSNNEPVAYIPLEVAHSDPVGASVFGYEPVPCNGYFLRKIALKKRPGKEVKKTTYTWAGGTFEDIYDDALLLALPADKKDPAILLRWSDVYVNYNDCSEMEQVPSQTSDLVAAGWIEVE